jgi:hypothetical protein
LDIARPCSSVAIVAQAHSAQYLQIRLRCSVVVILSFRLLSARHNAMKKFIDKHFTGDAKSNNTEHGVIDTKTNKASQSSSSTSSAADTPPPLPLLTAPGFPAPGFVANERSHEPVIDRKARRARHFTIEEKAFIVATHDRLLNHTYFVAAKGHSIWDDTLAALLNNYSFDKAPNSDTMRNVVRAQRLGHL